MSNDSQQDRIDDYLLGLGTPEDRKEFSEEISRNQHLSTQVAETELAMAAIEFYEDAALKTRLQDLEASLRLADATPVGGQTTKKEAKVVSMKPAKKANRSWMAIAASLLFLLAVGWYLIQFSMSSSPAQIAMANFEPYKNIAHQFERGATEESREADAYRAYEAGDYVAAERGFAGLPADGIRSFYRAQTLLAQEKFAEAEPVFLELSQSTSAFAKESEYYLALARVGLNKLPKAKPELTRIAGEADHPSQKEAKKLLDAL